MSEQLDNLQTFLKPEADTPVAPKAEEVKEPISLDDAFSSLVKGWENEQPGSAKQDVPTENPSTPKEDANSQTQTSEAAPGTAAPSPQVNEAEALRAKLIEDKDAQIKLYQSRLQELSNQYNQLKDVSQKVLANASAKEEPKAEMPAKMKELKELYPEIADAIDAAIEYKVGNPAVEAERIATEKAALVAMQVQQMQKQQHVNTILSKHPDMYEITQSQEARQWFESLDPIAKRGAQYVINYGTAPDVIALLDQYKAAKATGTTQLNNSANVSNLANRVAQMTAVPSSKLGLSAPANAPVEQPLTTEQAFARLAREYEKDPRSLR